MNCKIKFPLCPFDLLANNTVRPAISIVHESWCHFPDSTTLCDQKLEILCHNFPHLTLIERPSNHCHFSVLKSVAVHYGNSLTIRTRIFKNNNHKDLITLYVLYSLGCCLKWFERRTPKFTEHGGTKCWKCFVNIFDIANCHTRHGLWIHHSIKKKKSTEM